ncbi:MAG: serine protease [Planctomycetes bacterium]|nr:serine protease [Planctomycetota bacterium]
MFEERCMKIFLQCLIFGAFFVIGAGWSSGLLAQDAIMKMQSAVVSIESLDKYGKLTRQGSGFIINERGDFITINKVFHDAHSIQIKNIQGNVFCVKNVLAEDKESGLVLLATEGHEEGILPLPLNRTFPGANEQIMVVNSQFDAEHPVVNGFVSDSIEIPLFGKIIKIKALLPAGYCGSPVVNKEGEIIGILSFLSPDGFGYALSCERIENLMPVKEQALSEWIRSRVDSEWEFCREGISHLVTTEYEKAISSFQQATGKNRNHVNAYILIGYCKNKLGQYSDAIKDLKQAISLKPEFPEGYFQLGLSYFMLKQYQEAVEPLLDATRIDPQLFDAYFMLGLAHTALEQHRETVEAYRQAIRINKNVPELYFHLGIAYLQIENKLMAFEEYKILKDMNKHLASKLYQMIYQ